MITVSHLSHQYPLHHDQRISALDDISLTLSEGEYAAVIGPNGSGKTTLMQCLNGLIIPTAGRIRVDGLDPTDPETRWDVRRRVGMVFQNPDNQIISATVEREIAFGLENLGLPTPVIRTRVEKTLDRFNFAHYRHSPPHRLSGGEKQRLAIASVMAMEPKYLILDEPTSLLDPQNRRALLALLSEIYSEGKTTILHITQFPEEATRAHRLIVLADGRIIQDGIPRAIFERPQELRQWGLESPLAFQLTEALGEKGVRLPLDILSEHDEESGSASDVPVSGPATFDDGLKAPGALTVEHLDYIYDKGLPTQTAALKDVSVNIQRGECVGIIGPTGSGKTTFAEHCIGLLKPSTGSVRIEGFDLRARERALHEVRRKVGLVFQFPEHQFFEESVYEEVAFGPRNLGLGETEVEELVKDALERVGLKCEAFKNRAPLSLSAGEKRLVAVACILSMSPGILVLDEPTAGLDPQGVERIFELIRNFHASGATVVLISHNIDLVARVADRIFVLNEGTLLLQGPPQKVFEQHGLLRSIGLDIPEITAVMRALKKKGWTVKTDVFTLSDALDEILAHHPPSHTIP